jgi:hypothetical protein
MFRVVVLVFRVGVLVMTETVVLVFRAGVLVMKVTGVPLFRAGGVVFRERRRATRIGVVWLKKSETCRMKNC